MPKNTQEAESLRQKVLPLRQKGYTAEEMASKLGESKSQVVYAIRRLLERGEIKRRPLGYRSPRIQGKADTAIIRLRKFRRKMTNAQIAASINLKEHILNKRLVKLIKKGKVEPRANGCVARSRKKMLSFWKDRASPKLAEFVRLMTDRMPGPMVGIRFGCTGARVYQIRNLAIAQHGADLFKTADPWLTIPEFAARAHLTQHQVYVFCKRNQLPAEMKYGRYLIRESVLSIFFERQAS
jgi:predicted transcriptional regulator/predicted DNA-binding transcriptional regulator AlpA